MTLNQLRTFLAVVDLGSVRAAADRLVVSQPAVSGAVSALERELGVDLFERVGRGLRITPPGEAFAASARASLQQLDQGVRLVRSVDEPGRGIVRIAAIATAAERMLLPLLAEFRRAYPEAEVTVRVGNRATVWSALAALDVDLVVAGRPPAPDASQILGRASNELVVVGPPSESAGPGSRRALRSHLAAATWLLREEGSGTREATEELLTELGADPPRMILGSNGAVEAAVVAGFGVALLPLGAVRGRLATGAVVAIDCPGTPIDRPWHLVGSALHPLSPTARLAARALLESAGGFTPTTQGRRLLRGG